ncbi:hypothetical protein HPB52_009829 [Rhipicephalus sanguineus]|uniref:Uncharacterized protein n=1 Tax=Rhipicephalus sanguineus TaxID=34632 RepID=A0A9D4PB27_RHISA|nr:hypothetical protein HPB52_009829 [Rhipicephalus sanguineus]
MERDLLDANRDIPRLVQLLSHTQLEGSSRSERQNEHPETNVQAEVVQAGLDDRMGKSVKSPPAIEEYKNCRISRDRRILKGSHHVGDVVSCSVMAPEASLFRGWALSTPFELVAPSSSPSRQQR